MEIKGSQAIDYLRRARSTVHPDDQFYPVNALGSMLDIEIAYLESFQNKGANELVDLTIDSTGLPELPSWRSDLLRAWHELEEIRMQRAKGLLPLLSHITNLSTDKIVAGSERLTKDIDSDSPLLRALVSAPKAVCYYLENPIEVKFERSNGDRYVDFAPIIFNIPKFPGLLMFNEYHDYSSEIEMGEQTIEHDVSHGAFKYIDSLEAPRTLFANVHAYRNRYFLQDRYPDDVEMSIVRSMLPESSLASRSLWPRGENAEEQAKTILVFNDKSFVSGTNGEFTSRNLGKILFKTYLGFDFNGYSDTEVTVVVEALPKLNRLKQEMTQRFEKFTTETLIDPAEFQQGNAWMAAELATIFESLPKDEAKTRLQLAFAQTLKPLTDRMQAIADGPKPEVPQRRSLVRRLLRRDV